MGGVGVQAGAWVMRHSCFTTCIGLTHLDIIVFCVCVCVCVCLIGAVPLTSGFTDGVGQIWLDNVNCVGSETRLIDCPRSNPIGTHNCVHAEDAGVRCQAACKPPTVIRLILVY